MPIVYVIGEKDSLVPLSDIYKAAEENPNSRVEVFKGCKHWSVKEQPRKFCEICESILHVFMNHSYGFKRRDCLDLMMLMTDSDFLFDVCKACNEGDETQHVFPVNKTICAWLA